MTTKARDEAERYVKESLASQKRLGYSARVDREVVQAAVKETARAVDRMLRAQRHRAA